MASFRYRCTDCGRTFARDEVRYLCPVCGPAYRPGVPLLGVLEAIFDYEGIRAAFDPRRPDWNLFCAVEPEFHPSLPVGNTPLAPAGRLGAGLGLPSLWIKNDGLNPSGSLKDRASFLVAAEARRLGIDLIVAASTGNAASALAAVCASTGQQALIFVPEKAPKAKLVQMVLYGAKVVPVKGTYDDAFRLSLDYTARRGGLNRNTAYHPLTLEGKKTAALEIWAQLGFQVPDAVVVSVGDGVILGGVHKGFLDLSRAGLIDRLPRLIGVQAESSDAIHRLRADRQVLGRGQPHHPGRLHLGHLPQQRLRRPPGHPGQRRAHPHRDRRGDPRRPGQAGGRHGHLHRTRRRHRPGRPGQGPVRAQAPGRRRPGGGPGHRARSQGRGGAPVAHRHPPRHRPGPGGGARMRTLVRNGRAALPDRLLDADVLVQDGRIAAVGRLGDLPADRVLDASGCYVLPGLMDFHTHVDDQIGRFYLADTYESGTRAALLSGITTLCTFVTQGAGESLPTAMARARGKAEGHCHCDVLWHLTPTTFEPADLRALQTLVGAGYRTLKLYTTYKAAGIFASYRRIGELFGRLGPLGARFLVHCEDDEVIAGVDPGRVDLAQARAHTQLRPEAAEVVAIQKVVDLALEHQAALHVVHVSTADGAWILVSGRHLGDLTFETCPQYFLLDDAWLAREDGHHWLCSPPLRSGPERLRQMVRAGAADIIATDHCAFRPQDKDDWDHTDLRSVPNGLPGRGRPAPLGLEGLGRTTRTGRRSAWPPTWP